MIINYLFSNNFFYTFGKSFLLSHKNLLGLKLLFNKQIISQSGLQEEQGPFTGTPIVIIQNDKQEKCACPCKAHPSKPDKCPGPGKNRLIIKLTFMVLFIL